MKAVHLLVALGFIVSAGVPAQPSLQDHASHHASAPGSARGDASLTDGEVRKVNRDAQKLTLRHGPISNLGMPEMTMVFRVADPAMLDIAEQTQKVRFRAERVDGLLRITHIETAD